MATYSPVDENDLCTMEDIDRSIREKECIVLTALANSARWKMEQAGKSPRRIKIGERAAEYRPSETQVWICGEWHPGWEPGKTKQR